MSKTIKARVELAERRLTEFHEKWKLLKVKEMSHGMRLHTSTVPHGKRKRVLTYYVYREHFVDEDTGEVVSIDRNVVVMINDKVVDAQGKEIKFKF